MKAEVEFKTNEILHLETEKVHKNNQLIELEIKLKETTNELTTKLE